MAQPPYLGKVSITWLGSYYGAWPYLPEAGLLGRSQILALEDRLARDPKDLEASAILAEYAKCRRHVHNVAKDVLSDPESRKLHAMDIIYDSIECADISLREDAHVHIPNFFQMPMILYIFFYATSLKE